jgi:hypothetical protein
MHRLVDAADFSPQLGKRRYFRLGRFHHGTFCRLLAWQRPPAGVALISGATV